MQAERKFLTKSPPIDGFQSSQLGRNGLTCDEAFFLAKVAISAALLYFALRKTDFPDLIARMTPASLSWIASAVLIAIIQVVISAARWRTICEASGAPLSIDKAIRFSLIGGFFNQTLPSSVGGDAVRLWLVATSGVGWRAAAHSIFIDRAIGLIVLAIMIVASLPWSYQLITNPGGRLALLAIDFAALGCGLGFLIVGYIQSATLMKFRVWRHVHACSSILNGLLLDYRQAPRLIALSVVLHILTAVVAWFVTRAITAPVDFGELFLLIPPVLLITMIPVSIVGWGLREASMGMAFGYAGLAAGEGVNVSLLLGATYLAAGALGGLAWVTNREKRTAMPRNGHFPAPPSTDGIRWQ